jgi:hypothetical protein
MRTRQRLKWTRNGFGKIDCPHPDCVKKGQKGFTQATTALGHVKSFHPGLRQQLIRGQQLAPHIRNAESIGSGNGHGDDDKAEAGDGAIVGRIAASPIPPDEDARVDGTADESRVTATLIAASAMARTPELRGLDQQQLYRAADAYLAAAGPS